ncbi:MAG: AAA family ATPase [Acidimicrobiales bacterium]
MEPLEYLRVIRRRWRLLAACVLIAGVVAWITTPAHPSNDAVTYKATHQLIRDSRATAPPAIASLSIFVKTGEVPRRVAKQIGFQGEPALLASAVTLEPDETVGTLGITVTGSSPVEAAKRANAFADQTLAYLGEQSQSAQQEQLTRLNDQLATLQVDIDALDKKINSSGGAGSDGISEAQRDSKLRQYGAALDQQQQLLNQPPPSAGYVTLQAALPDLASPVGGGFTAPRSRPARTGIAIVLGLLLGLAAVLMAERLDTRLNTREAAQAGFRLPVIAEVPRTVGFESSIVSAIDPLSSTAEAYRTLRASLVLIPTTALGGRGKGEQSPQVILVTSPAPGDGKTTTVANLAACFAEAGRSVLVLGCDFRRPAIHRYFGLDARPGISDVLVGAKPDLASVVRPTSLARVSLASSGSSLRNFGDVANAGRELVAQARALADIVIIDTAPILATNDATELIPSADAVVVVARVGRTSLDGATRTHTLLERLSAPAAGVVLVGVSSGEMAYSSYYTSVTPAPPSRVSRLRRRIRADEITDRIQPWRAVPAPPARPAASPASAPAAPDAPAPVPDHPPQSSAVRSFDQGVDRSARHLLSEPADGDRRDITAAEQRTNPDHP